MSSIDTRLNCGCTSLNKHTLEQSTGIYKYLAVWLACNNMSDYSYDIRDCWLLIHTDNTCTLYQRYIKLMDFGSYINRG